ncbi:MAG: 4Fe-4S dicluster domain-containing protein [candidate division Zixibacteria bacterium]|nr:4Fe-4S dicluster domain-containing protein [candidate division Zixibacteria bacterium]
MAAKGRIEVDHVRCKGCELCLVACPKDVLALADEFSANGYYPATMVNPDNCNGCALCAIACPEVAIEVWKSKE